MKTIAIILLASLAGCATDPTTPEPPTPIDTSKPEAAAGNAEQMPEPSMNACSELAPNDSQCCMLWCSDLAAYQAQCAVSGFCVKYDCQLTDGTVIQTSQVCS